MKKEIISRLHRSFEDCAHLHDGVEYWLARELQALLGYTDWRNFLRPGMRPAGPVVNSPHGMLSG